MPKQTAQRSIDTPYSVIRRTSALAGGVPGVISYGLTTLEVQSLIDASIVNHVALADPHPTYLTTPEGDARYSLLGHIHDDRYYTETETQSFAGSGLIWSSGFNVGAGDGISVAADAVHVAVAPSSGLTFLSGALTLGAPSSASVSSTNSITGSTHTHAVTASSNPGASAILLASNASGGLTLVSLTTTGAISGAANTNTSHLLGYATVGFVGFNSFAGFAASNFANTTDYALVQHNVNGLVYLNGPTSVNHRIANSNIFSTVSSGVAVNDSKSIGLAGYVSGWAGSGWRIDNNISFAGESFLEVDNLSVRRTMNVYELVINQIRSTNGTLIVSSPGKIESVSGSNWTFEDPEGSNLCAFAVNDLVIIQDVDVNLSTIVRRIVRRVSAVSGKTVTVTAAAGGPVDVGVPRSGDTVVRFGNVTNAARQGVVLITSDFSNSPYMDVINGVASWADWVGNSKTHVRLGNLSGITSTANEYGFMAGAAGFTVADSWIKMSSAGASFNKVDIASRNGSALTISLQSDGDIFAGANAAAVATTSFAHFGVAQTYGSEAMGAGDVVIGNKSAGHMFWDASTGRLNFRNGTTVQSYVDTAGQIVAGAGSVILNSSGVDVAGGVVILNSSGATVASTVTLNSSGITIPGETAFYSDEPVSGGGEIGLALSNAAPTRLHVGKLEMMSYGVAFDSDNGKRDGAIIRVVPDSYSGTLYPGPFPEAYTGVLAVLTIEAQGKMGATPASSYIRLEAGNRDNFSNSNAFIGASDIYLGGNLYVGNSAPYAKFIVNFSTGNVTSGVLSAASDTDAVHVLGRAKIGYDGTADRAAFAHFDHMSVNNRALEQTSDGTVIMNCAPSTSLQFKIGNTNYLYLTTVGFRVGGSAAPTEALDVTGNIKASGTVKTTLGAAWDLGAYTAGAPAATGYVTIKINGTTYRLLSA